MLRLPHSMEHCSFCFPRCSGAILFAPMSVSKPGSNSAYLRRLLKRGGKEFDQRRTAAEEAVVRREFYSEDAINPRPYYHERFEMKRGRRLKQTTAKACEFGFDAKGRVPVEIGRAHV